MARKPRIHFPGAFYHVTLHGNGGSDIFFDDHDRCRFCLLLQQCAERYDCRIHAFCLMTDHAHLALQVGTIPLSRFMQNLAFRYTRWVNSNLQRSGHLFQGRYKATVYDPDQDLLPLIAHLHLNPVRAGQQRIAEDYPWSSHRAYLGQELIPWLNVEPTLSRMSADVDRAQHLFGAFVAGQKDAAMRMHGHATKNLDSRICGKESFVKQALRRAGQQPLRRPGLDLVMQSVTEVFGVSEKELRRPGQGVRISEVRALLSWAVLELSDATLKDLSQRLGRDASTLSSAVRRLHLKADSEPEVAAKMDQLNAALTMFATLQA